MDLWMQFALWSVTGVAVCALVGKRLGMTGEGAAIGLALGPVLGAVVVLLTARYDPPGRATRRL